MALGAGKSVLFVTEKPSARSVITDNLRRCYVDGIHHLTDYVLDFNDLSRNKRMGGVKHDSFVEAINSHLQIFNDLNGCNGLDLDDEKYSKSQIALYTNQLKQKHDGRCYMELLQDVARFAKYPNLIASSIPGDSHSFAELCDLVEKYFVYVQKGYGQIDYRKDKLFGCKGDANGKLARLAIDYKDVVEALRASFAELRSLGWFMIYTEEALKYCVEVLTLWQQMPILNSNIQTAMSEAGIEKLLITAEERRRVAKDLESHVGNEIEQKLNVDVYADSDIDALLALSDKYRAFYSRIGSKYHSFLSSVTRIIKGYGGKQDYDAAKYILAQLVQYRSFKQQKKEYENTRKGDFKLFGEEPISENDWSMLISKLNAIKAILHKTDPSIVDAQKCKVWLSKFGHLSHKTELTHLKIVGDTLGEAISEEKALSDAILDFFDSHSSSHKYPYCEALAQTIKNECSRLSGWKQIYEVLTQLKAKGWIHILDELISKGIQNKDAAGDTLRRAFSLNAAIAYVDKYKLSSVASFSRAAHEETISHYATIDKQVLDSGAKRLYTFLSDRCIDELQSQGISSTELPRLSLKKGSSIKQLIADNWDYIKTIKPCILMSPLNVSEYIDIGITFDLVIFDEASQIFTEDALATIARGKQIIVAGDSKQLPPCDFFKVGDVSLDESEVYFDEESNAESSLLTTLDKAMNDYSIQLSWHYRSCDEALIAFSNKHMNYNLISFPSAVKNHNDGVKHIRVSYDPKTCYDAGKGGAHINKGEARRVVALIWAEITNVERQQNSVGVVAFSNAQAQEIEKSWELFKQQLDDTSKQYYAKWESEHLNEPIIFRNLDTMQGDERDTMILSICYSQDAKGKFSLPYLGRLRLESGKKRLNVAVTRARHRMVVVSTLTYDVLINAVNTSSAPEENKGGARMLAAFLKYAESFEIFNDVVSMPSSNPFVHSVCEVLDENDISYDTEVGRSDCKISVAIRDTADPKSFVLGIIIDDSRRTDFDSPREYARLTTSILENKYHWKIYRIFPHSWIYDFDEEKKRLLNTIRSLI